MKYFIVLYRETGDREKGRAQLSQHSEAQTELRRQTHTHTHTLNHSITLSLTRTHTRTLTVSAHRQPDRQPADNFVLRKALIPKPKPLMNPKP